MRSEYRSFRKGVLFAGVIKKVDKGSVKLYLYKIFSFLVPGMRLVVVVVVAGVTFVGMLGLVWNSQ
jgi:hypothetical protein